MKEYSPASALTIGPAHDALVELDRGVVGARGRAHALEEEEERCGDGEELGSRAPDLQPPAQGVGTDRERDGPDRGDQLERDVVGQEEVEEDDHQRRERKVELPGRKAREPVRGPAGDPPRRQEMVPEVGGEPDVGAHVAAVGGRVAEQQARVELVQDQQAARQEHDDAEQPPPQAQVRILGWELGVGGRRHLGKRAGCGRERLRRELAHRHPLSMAATTHHFGSLLAPVKFSGGAIAGPEVVERPPAVLRRGTEPRPCGAGTSPARPTLPEFRDEGPHRPSSPSHSSGLPALRP